MPLLVMVSCDLFFELYCKYLIFLSFLALHNETLKTNELFSSSTNRKLAEKYLLVTKWNVESE